MARYFSVASTILSVLIVFCFMAAIYQWNVAHEVRYLIVEEMMPAFLIVMGVVFASGFQIITDAVTREFPKVPKESVLLGVAVFMVFALPFIVLVASVAPIVTG